MKKAHILTRSTTSLFVLATLLLASCKKDDNAVAVTEADAADAITQAVIPASGGIAVQATDAARIAVIYSSNCGVSKDSAIVRTNASGAAVTYTLTANWHWLLTCSTSRFDFTFTSASSYDAPRVSSADQLTAAWSVTGLQPAATQYLVNAELTRNGTQVSKVRNKNTFTSQIHFVSSNVAIDKQSQQIVSGTWAVTITGAGARGGSFSYAGTLLFTGSRTATLTLNSGVTYAIEW